MKTNYSECSETSIWFDQTRIKTINELAMNLELPRNTVIMRLFNPVLSDVNNGRKIFGEEAWTPRLSKLLLAK